MGYTPKNEPFYFDLEDYEKIKDYCWSYNENKYLLCRQKGNNHKQIRMHRLIMNALDGQEVDHKNHITFDNRKNNLRICTSSQNSMNKSNLKVSGSRVVGVFMEKQAKGIKWIARIRTDNKQIVIGRFENFEDAVLARKNAEIKYFGEFAYNKELDLRL